MKKINTFILTMAITSASAVAVTPRGVDPANLDKNVSPGTDFYQYACGGWMKANPLKPEYSRFGTFDQLAELNRQQVYDLIMGLDAKSAAKGSNTQKIADLFALGMDSVRLNAEGAKPLAADLARINNATREEVIDLMATLPGVNAFFGTGVEADMMNADMNVMYWGQGGLGLGDRDYYIKDGENEKRVLEAYRKYLITIAELAGYSPKDANRLATNAISVEKTLARAATSREELRNPMAGYNPMSMV